MKLCVHLFSCVLLATSFAQMKAPEGSIVKVADREVYVHAANYDKTKIPPYTLESPLKFVDGRAVTRETWNARREEILGIFAREMYGQPPPPPEAVVTELVDEKVTVAGFAIRRQYRMWFKADKSGPCVSWIVWLPRHAKGPVPVISHYNYGNEKWQRGQPLADISFIRVTATGLKLPLSAWGDPRLPLSLTFKDCRLGFERPQKELIRGAHVGTVSIDNLEVQGVDGPLIRLWNEKAGKPQVSASGLKGISAEVVPCSDVWSVRGI